MLSEVSHLTKNQSLNGHLTLPARTADNGDAAPDTGSLIWKWKCKKECECIELLHSDSYYKTTPQPRIRIEVQEPFCKSHLWHIQVFLQYASVLFYPDHDYYLHIAGKYENERIFYQSGRRSILETDQTTNHRLF